MLFEVSEDIKSSSVGAKHWSTGPIAPSRAKKNGRCFGVCEYMHLFMFILLVKWSGVLYTVHDMEKFAAVSGDHISGGKKQSRKESRCVQYVFG